MLTLVCRRRRAGDQTTPRTPSGSADGRPAAAQHMKHGNTTSAHLGSAASRTGCCCLGDACVCVTVEREEDQCSQGKIHSPWERSRTNSCAASGNAHARTHTPTRCTRVPFLPAARCCQSMWGWSYNRKGVVYLMYFIYRRLLHP